MLFISKSRIQSKRFALYLGGPCHPWQFIEEAAMREVERDFSSVYSRLVLCKTYRLDEDGKVLTPEEVRWKILLIYELDFKTLLSCKQDYNVLC